MINRKKIVDKIINEHVEKDEDTIKRLIKRRKKIDRKYFVVDTFANGREGFDITHFSLENRILLNYYQQILKSAFSVKMPNRNNIIDELLNIAPYVDKYRECTIFKFDLKKFYKSIDVSKVINKISHNQFLYPNEISFISNTFSEFANLYPGIGIVNYMVEILGQDFDNIIKNLFKENLIFYSRYIDDCILIVDCKISESEIKARVSNEIEKCFGKNAKFNTSKSCYIDLSNTVRFDYLGYCFNYEIRMKQNGKRKYSFSFGIASSKLIKEKNKIEKIVKAYLKDSNEELLLIRLDLYFRRLVYLNKQEGKRKAWEVRGISQTYSEAKKLIEWDKEKKEFNSKMLLDETYLFFKGEFIKAAFIKLGIDYPDKIKNRVENGKYLSLLFSNRAVILHKNIGYKYKTLYDILERLKFNVDSSMSYKQLAKIYKKEIYNL